VATNSAWLTMEPAPEPRAATRIPSARVSATTWATARKYPSKPSRPITSSSLAEGVGRDQVVVAARPGGRRDRRRHRGVRGRGKDGETQAADLLDDTLTQWAAAGAGPDVLKFLDLTTDLDPQGSATEWSDASGSGPSPDGKASLPSDPDGVPAYAVMLATTHMPDGRPLPMLILEGETAGAGLADLRRRTNWQAWDGSRLPEPDVNWRLRVDIATRSLECLAQIDPDGYDVLPHLWDASETVPLPEPFWDLLDRAQHVLVAGPVKDGEDQDAFQGAADTGELLAVVARVRFM
jgi:hypothetical protein